MSTIFIVPHKIQKRRLEDMKKSAAQKGILLVDELSCKVTHIVVECESLDQAERLLSGYDYEQPKDDSVEIVSIKWFIDCLKKSCIVPVEQSHRLIKVEQSQHDESERSAREVSEWACQRVSRLDHRNNTFTRALEILQEHAELRDGPQDYSRALAFRRASCVLKSLNFDVTDVSQLEGFKDIGHHVRRVIVDILDHGYSDEVEDISKSAWFRKMKLFTGVFGVGPATANKWIDRGFETIQDVKKAGSVTADWRCIWGLAFWEDLNKPVSKKEGLSFLDIVKSEAEEILPGVIVELCGGFRRGKTTGHDVDILLSHPEEGAEIGILSKLLKVLEHKGLILIGHREKGNFRPEVLHQDFKLSSRGQLDHFEKWLGICKFPKTFQDVCDSRKDSACSSDNSNDSPKTVTNDNSLHVKSRKDADQTPLPHDTRPLKPQSLDHESLDEAKYEPAFKKSRLKCGDAAEPEVLAGSERDWLARRVDLIVAPHSQFYYALVGWTGSKHFNRDARLYAQKVLGLKLTSHGLYDVAKNVPIPATSEREVFDHLKLPYRQPEERNC